MSKILIIEDEISLLDEVAEWLHFEGYEVFKASNGIDGLNLAIEKKPDLILSDIMLPGIDGLKLFSFVNENPDLTETAFIFISALTDRQAIRKGMDMGADDYITKPFTSKELFDAIRARLTKSEKHDKHAEHRLNDLRRRIMMHLPHELLTPLNAIMGFGSILSEAAELYTADEIKGFGVDILEGSKRLHRLIENYILYVQLELRTEVPFESITKEVVEAVLFDKLINKAKYYNRLDDFRITMESSKVQIAEEIFILVCGELFDNAFKFSQPGSVVSVSSNINGDYLQICIHDQGCGFEPSDIKRIGVYMQFDRDKKEQQGGGLGLIIAKRFIELSGGMLQIESKKGEWTKVNVFLKIIHS